VRPALNSLVPSSQITQQSTTVMELSMSCMEQVMNSDTTVKVTVGPRK
jgi:hypothetical protein